MDNVSNCINLGAYGNPNQPYCTSKRANYCSHAKLEPMFDKGENIGPNITVWMCDKYRILGTDLYELTDREKNPPSARKVEIVRFSDRVPDLIRIMDNYENGEPLDIPNLEDLIPE